MVIRALLISPHEQIVRVLGALLRELGVEVQVCRNAGAAVSSLEKGKFQAVVVDWDIDDLVKAIPKIAHEKAGRHPNVVALMDSGLSALQAFRDGATFVLYKPISKDRAKTSLQFALKLSGQERRQKPRRPVHLGTKISYGASEKAVTLLNLSPAGTAVQSPQRLPGDCKIYFDFQIPGEKTPIRMAGTVVWQDSSGRTGIRFSNLPEASRRVLNQWSEVSGPMHQQALSLEDDLQREEEVEPSFEPETVVVRQLIPLAEKKERRKQSRYACSSGVQVKSPDSDVPHWCSLNDISMGGCYIEMTAPFPKNTQLVIELRTQTARLRTRGVVRSANAGQGMGIEFGFDEDEQRADLQKMITYLGGGGTEAAPAPVADRRHNPET